MNSEELKRRFAEHYKAAGPGERRRLSEAHETGYDEAYWDWRGTILSWFQKGSIEGQAKDSLLTYLEELRNKPKPG